MKAIVLVGGMGTRLRPLTLRQPKGLLPVLNRPFLWYQLDLMKQGGVTDVMFAAGRNSKPWETGLRSLRIPGVRLHFCYEPKPLGTGGAIRFSADALEKKTRPSDEPILVLNGDVFFELDIKAFQRFHQARKAVGTVALTQVEDPSRFGVVLTAADGRIRRFIEKPTQPVGTNLINAGAYLLAPEWIRRIPAGKASSIERDAFPSSLERGEPLFGFAMPGYWNDIGTHATYLQAHHDLMSRKTRWTRSPLLRKRAAPHAAVRLLVGQRSAIAKDVVFEGNVCLGNNVIVGAGSRIKNSVLLDRVRIGANVSIEGSILGARVRVDANAVIGAGSVLGEGTRISDFTRC